MHVAHLAVPVFLAGLYFGDGAAASIITYEFTNVHGESTAHASGAAFFGSIVYDSELSALIHADVRSGAATGVSASAFLPFNYNWDGLKIVNNAGGAQQSGGIRNPDGVGSFLVDFGDVSMAFGPTEIFVNPGEEPLAKLLRSEPSWNLFTDDGWQYNLAFNDFRYSQLTIVPEPGSLSTLLAGLIAIWFSKRKLSKRG